MVRHTRDKAGWESNNLPIRSQTGDLQGEACNFGVQGGSFDAFDLLPGLFSEPLGETHGETHNKFNLEHDGTVCRGKPNPEMDEEAGAKKRKFQWHQPLIPPILAFLVPKKPTGAALVVHGKHGVPAALHKAPNDFRKNWEFFALGVELFMSSFKNFLESWQFVMEVKEVTKVVLRVNCCVRLT